MVDRQFVGDVMLALLVAIPTAALAQPEAVPHRHSPDAVKKSTQALAPAGDRQIGLYR
ncbi:MAG TPA: hypothetical protein VE820_12530 [Sphingomicrobium sp.]|jgi:hypothetical protein|nr:hypothetical protein [Sphingomicrobium sp.]